MIEKNCEKMAKIEIAKIDFPTEKRKFLGGLDKWYFFCYNI